MAVIAGHTVVLANNVKETTQTTGTGTYQLDGATGGAVGFVAGVGGGNKTVYRVQSGSSWEIGIGTVAAGSPPTVARTQILSSSNAGNVVSWAAGIKDIFVTAPAQLLDQIGVVGVPGSDVITNTMLTNMPSWSFKIRNAGTSGDPSDAALANITTDAAPESTDFLIGFLSTGEIRKWTMSSVQTSAAPSPGSVTNAILADMPAWTIKIRNASSTGNPSDAALGNITTDGNPANGDFVLGFLSTGEIRKYTVGSIQPSVPAAPLSELTGTSIDTTSGTTKTITGIDSRTRHIRVLFRNVSTTGVSPLIVQLGDSGGFETSGYSGCVMQVSESAQQVFNFSSGFAIHNAAVAARTYSGHVLLSAVDNDGLAWVASITIGQDQDGAHYGGGFKILSGRLTQVRVTSDSGANEFDVGSINVHMSE